MSVMIMSFVVGIPGGIGMAHVAISEIAAWGSNFNKA